MKNNPSKQVILLPLFIALLLLSLPGLSLSWEDKVVGVSDGDTITVMHQGQGEKIRLYGIEEIAGEHL